MGSKWSMRALRAKYQEMGINSEEVFSRIKDVIIKTCISVEPNIVNQINRYLIIYQLRSKHKNMCFELYGFDILLDENLKPWLLEVNISPSLSSSSPLDKRIKTTLLCDVLNIVGIVPYDKKKFEKDEETTRQERFLGIKANKSIPTS